MGPKRFYGLRMEDRVLIRPATAQDAKAVAEFNVIADEGLPLIYWGQEAPAGVDPLEYGASLAARPEYKNGFSNSDIAEIDGEVVGGACSYAVGPHRAGQDYMAPFHRLKSLFSGAWYLDFISVLPEARGQGVATLLIDAAAKRGARAGVGTLCLLMLDTNTAAHRAYQRAGFKIAARETLPQDRPWPPPEVQEVIAFSRKI